MTTTTKTKWGAGFVSIHEKYIKEALSRNEGLTIYYGDDFIVIPYLKLLEARPRSAVYEDKFSKEKYKIYDFLWKSYKSVEQLTI